MDNLRKKWKNYTKTSRTNFVTTIIQLMRNLLKGRQCIKLLLKCLTMFRLKSKKIYFQNNKLENKIAKS